MCQVAKVEECVESNACGRRRAPAGRGRESVTRWGGRDVTVALVRRPGTTYAALAVGADEYVGMLQRMFGYVVAEELEDRRPR